MSRRPVVNRTTKQSAASREAFLAKQQAQNNALHGRQWEDYQEIPGASMHTFSGGEREGRPQVVITNFRRAHYADPGTGAKLMQKVTSRADREGVVLQLNTVKGKEDTLGKYYQGHGFEPDPETTVTNPKSPLGPGYVRRPK